jgi:hypothetical protein
MNTVVHNLAISTTSALPFWLMDYIDKFASHGVGAEAEDDVQAKIESYETGCLGICDKLDNQAGGCSPSGSEAQHIQQNISKLSEVVMNSSTAKILYGHPSSSSFLSKFLFRLWNHVKAACLVHRFIKNGAELEPKTISAEAPHWFATHIAEQ